MFLCMSYFGSYNAEAVEATFFLQPEIYLKVVKTSCEFKEKFGKHWQNI